MIKSVVANEPTPQEKKFPRLMQHTDGTIVLFSEEGIGVAVVACGKTSIGETSTIWHMYSFTDFNGSVTLQND